MSTHKDLFICLRLENMNFNQREVNAEGEKQSDRVLRTKIKKQRGTLY